MDADHKKKVYTTPRLSIYGTVEAITRGNITVIRPGKGNSDKDPLDLNLPSVIREKDRDLPFSFS